MANTNTEIRVPMDIRCEVDKETGFSMLIFNLLYPHQPVTATGEDETPASVEVKKLGLISTELFIMAGLSFDEECSLFGISSKIPSLSAGAMKTDGKLRVMDEMSVGYARDLEWVDPRWKNYHFYHHRGNRQETSMGEIIAQATMKMLDGLSTAAGNNLYDAVMETDEGREAFVKVLHTFTRKAYNLYFDYVMDIGRRFLEPFDRAREKRESQ